MARQAMRVNRHRWLLATTASVALLGAACGGSDSKTTSTGATGATGVTSAASSSSSDAKAVLGAAGTDAKGSAAIPADALFFASANIDQGSDAWKQLIATSSRFPGFAKISQDFTTQLQKQTSDGTTFANDVQPWLGGEVAIGVTGVDISGGSNASKAQFVVYVQSKDDAKALAAVQKDSTPGADYSGYKTFTSKPTSGEDPAYGAVGDGAVLVANSMIELQTAIDTRSGKSPSLATDAAFGATLAKLPQDNLAVAYVAGSKLSGLVQTAISAAAAQGGAAAAASAAQPALQQYSAALSKIQGIAMSFRAEDDGYRFETLVNGDLSGLASVAGSQLDTYSPTLAARVPADAVAFLSFHDLGKSIQPVLDQALAANASAKDQLTQAESQLGLSVKDDIIPLFLGEHAAWVGGQGTPIGAGLLLHPADAAAGAKTVKQLVALAGASAGAQATDVPGGQQLALPSQGTSVFWRQVDDVLAFSNVATAGDKPSASLADSDAYKSALDTAGVKGDVSGLLWVNIAGAIQLAQSKGAQLNAEQTANTAPLRSLVYWGSKDGDDTVKADLFLQVAK